LGNRLHDRAAPRHARVCSGVRCSEQGHQACVTPAAGQYLPPGSEQGSGFRV